MADQHETPRGRKPAGARSPGRPRHASGWQSTSEPAPLKPLLTTGQAARALGLSVQTVRNWVASGRLPGVMRGVRVMVPREAVLAEIRRSVVHRGQTTAAAGPLPREANPRLMAHEASARSGSCGQDLAADGELSADRLVGIDEPDVRLFLRERPELAALVSEAAREVVSRFPDARLKIELLRDPEYNGDEQLFLGVSTQLEEEQALEALRRLDDEWWVHHAGRARGQLCIDLADRELRLG